MHPKVVSSSLVLVALTAAGGAFFAAGRPALALPQTAAKATPTWAPGGSHERLTPDNCLVALIDHPLIDAGTVRALIATRDATGAPVVRPICDGRHGHPVIFSRETFAMLRFGDLPDGAKGVLRAFASREVLMPTVDRGVLVDVDTPDDYRALNPESH